MRALGTSIDRGTDMSRLSGLAKIAWNAGWPVRWPRCHTLRCCRSRSERESCVRAVGPGLRACRDSYSDAHNSGSRAPRPFHSWRCMVSQGRGQVLAAAFVNVIQTHGGSIRTDADVARIRIEARGLPGLNFATVKLCSLMQSLPRVTSFGPIETSWASSIYLESATTT